MGDLFSLKFLSIFFIAGGVAQLVLGHFYYNRKPTLLPALYLVFGFTSLLLNEINTTVFSALLFLFVGAAYILEFSSIKLKYIKVAIIGASSFLLFMCLNIPTNQWLKLALALLLFLLLPHRSQYKIKNNNRFLTKNLHFMYQGLLIYLAPVMESNSLMFLSLLGLLVLSFSLFFHSTYNKNNEDLMLSTFILLLVLIGKTPDLLLYIFAFVAFIAEFKEDSFYGHSKDELAMSSWLSPLGVKSLAAVSLLFFTKGLSLEIEAALYVFILVAIVFSSYRPKKIDIAALQTKQNRLFQKILWIVFLLSFVGGHYVTAI